MFCCCFNLGGLRYPPKWYQNKDADKLTWDDKFKFTIIWAPLIIFGAAWKLYFAVQLYNFYNLYKTTEGRTFDEESPSFVVSSRTAEQALLDDVGAENPANVSGAETAARAKSGAATLVGTRSIATCVPSQVFSKRPPGDKMTPVPRTPSKARQTRSRRPPPHSTRKDARTASTTADLTNVASASEAPGSPKEAASRRASEAPVTETPSTPAAPRTPTKPLERAGNVGRTTSRTKRKPV
ncbi:uncharacterized protein LOC144144586 [Haemaphysalis longicornis]